MTPGRMLMFPLVLIVFPVAKGQSCSFSEVAGQKGSDSLRSDSAIDTSLSACKTLCNTTELCIAGDFISTTNTCHIYLTETNLTDQTDWVFFQWACTMETNGSDGFPVALTVGLVVGAVALVGTTAAVVVGVKRYKNGKIKTESEGQEKEKTSGKPATASADEEEKLKPENN